MTEETATLKDAATESADPKSLIKHSGSSRAIRSKEVTFNCAPAQRLLERNFETVSSRLYNIGVMIPLLTTPEIADAVEQVTIKYFEEIENDIEKKIAQLQEIMHQHDISDSIEFTHARTFKCDITTRYAARYLRLVQRYELLVTCIEAMWLEEALDNSARNQAIFMYQRRVGKLNGKLVHIDNNLKRIRELGNKATMADISILTAAPDADKVVVDPSAKPAFKEIDTPAKEAKESTAA